MTVGAEKVAVKRHAHVTFVRVEHNDEGAHMPAQVGAHRFGRRVRQERKARDWSQAELAERMTKAGYPLHQTAVARIESGKRPTTIQEVYALAAVLGVPSITALLSSGGEDMQLLAQITRKHAQVTALETDLAAARLAAERVKELERDLAEARAEHEALVRDFRGDDWRLDD